MRRRHAYAGLCFVVIVGAVTLSAQTAYRLRGTTRSGSKPIVATVSAEAIHGFRGEQFTGQKTFSVPSNDKGDWTLLGLTAGVWLFTATAPDALPAVAILPIRFSQRQMQSAQGGQMTWALPLSLAPAAEHPSIAGAGPLIAEGRTLEALQLLSPALAPDAKPALQCAAGQMALAIKQPTLALQLFTAVMTAEPKNPCGPLGMSAAALIRADWDTASKMLWMARDLAPKEQRPSLAAAVTELQQVASLK
ncbi:MAG: hypothetical protein IT178_06150 [Acidobacteria bacterium]|nr:hypothetical protein [Acidobacteriota bacterium]